MTTYRRSGMNPTTFRFSCDSMASIYTPPSFIEIRGLVNGIRDITVGVSTKIQINKLKRNAADLLNYETFLTHFKPTSRMFSSHTIYNFCLLHFFKSFRKIKIFYLQSNFILRIFSSKFFPAGFASSPFFLLNWFDFSFEIVIGVFSSGFFVRVDNLTIVGSDQRWFKAVLKIHYSKLKIMYVLYLEAFGIGAVASTVDVLHGKLLSLTVVVFVLVSDVTVPKTFTNKFQRLSLRITVNFAPNNVHIWHSTHCRFHWKFLKIRKFNTYSFLIISVFTLRFSIFSNFCFFSGFMFFLTIFFSRANF